MPHFEISGTFEVEVTTHIEAENEKEARDKFENIGIITYSNETVGVDDYGASVDSCYPELTVNGIREL